MLGTAPEALHRGYDVALLDLDGVVYVGGAAVPGAVPALTRASSQGLRCAYITNNAARPPDVVAAHLCELGLDVARQDVVTSAQAAGRVLLDRLGPERPVAVLGAEGLAAAIAECGLRPVGVEDEAEAIVTGFGPDVPWRSVMRAAVRIRDGLWWVAANADLTLPTSYGVAPGHGVLVRTLADFSGVSPVVAGKPAAPLLEETVRRTGSTRPLMVGDRLDTDIEGARRLGMDSLLVLTGVTGLTELVAAHPAERPTFLGSDLRTLLAPHPEVWQAAGASGAGGWTAEVHAGRLRVTGAGAVDDWWRAVAVAAWSHRDRTGRPVDAADLADRVPPAPAPDR